MTLKLNIDRVVIGVAEGQRIDPATLKDAIERGLAGMVERGGIQGISSEAVKTLAPRDRRRPPGRSDQVQLALNVVASIYQAAKR